MADSNGFNGGGEHLDIDLNVNLSEESYLNDFSELDPYTRMILGHDTGGDGGSSLSNYIDLDENGREPFPSYESGMTRWMGQSSEAETGQHHGAPPGFDNYQMASATATAPSVGYDGRAGPSTSTHNQHHMAGPSTSTHNQNHHLKRERPEDAVGGVGIRIGGASSSDQRNVWQRLSYENQQNSNHVQPPQDESNSLFLLNIPSSSAFSEPTIQDAASVSSSREAAAAEPAPAPALPEYLHDDVIPLRMLYPFGPETEDMLHTHTYLYPHNGFHGSNNNASSSASHGLFEHFHEVYVPAVLSHLFHLNAGPFGNHYRGQTSNNQFGLAAGPILQDEGFLGNPPIVGLNRRGEPLTGAALVRRSSNIHAPPLSGIALLERSSNLNAQIARLLNLSTLLAGSDHWGATNLVPIVEPVPNWLPAYFPAGLHTVPNLDPVNWLPAYLAPAHQLDNNFTPVTWDDFEEEDEEEEIPYDDVESMTYEELLALEDTIGDVSTGLSEETIRAKLKPKKYSCFRVGPPGEEGICCICQEEYEEGEMVARLSCRHEFHFDCIKQWLVRKNSCPMCKMTAIVV